MELLFLALLVILMALALGSGFPVAFALPGSAIISILAAAGAGWLFAGDADAYFAQDGPVQWLSAGVINLRGVYWEVERDTLIAIPLFIFMGIMLQRSKIAEDLLMTMASLFGPIPGGLGISVVFVGALLAATTGILGATVVAMGLISLPAMLRKDYSAPLATGTIAASGTLGQIIPPSIVLIILADQLASAVDQASSARKNLFKDSTGELSMPSEFDVASTSAGEMFLGAFVPGLVLVVLYMSFILIVALIRPSLAPAVRSEGSFDRQFVIKVVLTLVPPLALIFLVLGSIISGIATVNQAGAIGAAGALIMAGYRLSEGRRGAYIPAIMALGSLATLAFVLSNYDTNVKSIDSTDDVIGVTLAAAAVIVLLIALIWSGMRTLRIDRTLHGVMLETAKTTSLVFIILLGAAMLTAAFRAFGGEELVRDYLNSLPGGFWSKFLTVMLVIFFLGFFLDFIEIAVVVVPIVAPILLADPSANITAVWLGVMIGLNIQTSFLTPPFGFALFYLRGVAPAAVKTIQMYKGVIAFICLQLVALGIVGMNPWLVNYLPNRVSLTSETAPPPRNPRMQYCIEEFVAADFAENGDAIRKAIAEARSWDISYLPKKMAEATTEGLDQADASFGLLADVAAAEKAVNDASGEFRPLHREVRQIEQDVRKLEERIKEIKVIAGRLRDPSQAERKVRLEERMAALEGEKEALLAGIPENWDEVYGNFNKLVTAERNARRTYRRAVDQAYEPVVNLNAALSDVEGLRALEGDLAAMRDRVGSATAEEMEEPMKDLARRFGSVEGGSAVKSAISKSRRALTAKNQDREKAVAEITRAVTLLSDELIWLDRAAKELAPGVAAYEDAIRATIGVRQQPKLTRTQALYVAGCNAGHRDISLNF